MRILYARTGEREFRRCPHEEGCPHEEVGCLGRAAVEKTQVKNMDVFFRDVPKDATLRVLSVLWEARRSKF